MVRQPTQNSRLSYLNCLYSVCPLTGLGLDVEEELQLLGGVEGGLARPLHRWQGQAGGGGSLVAHGGGETVGGCPGGGVGGSETAGFHFGFNNFFLRN